MSELRDLGVKRKEMNGGPCCAPCPAACNSEEYDNEIIHPCLDLYGRAATMFPLKEMKPGVVYRTEVLIRLKRVSLDEKSRVDSGSLAVVAIGDLEPEAEEKSDEPVVKVMKKAGAYAS